MRQFYKRIFCIALIGMFLAGCQNADVETEKIETEDMTDTEYTKEIIIVTTAPDKVVEETSWEESSEETEPEIIRSDPPAPLEEFMEYYWELLASGDEKKMERYTISRWLTMEEAVSLKEYEALNHLETLERGRENAERTMIAAADLDDDGKDDIVEYHENMDCGGGTYSYSLSVYRNEGNGYRLMYSHPLFDGKGDFRIISYEEENYLEIEGTNEKDIYWLRDWKLAGKAHMRYDRTIVEGNLEYCDRDYQDEGKRVEAEAANLCRELPNSITYPLSELEIKDGVRGNNLFWGDQETCVAFDGRGEIFRERYTATMEKWKEYVQNENPEKKLHFYLPYEDQIFRCDINNDGAEEEYIKSYGPLGIFETETWRWWENISRPTGRIYGKHEGEWGLLVYMESDGKETDFYRMCGLDIWNRELTPRMFWVERPNEKNIIYLLFSDENRTRSEIEGYEINGKEYRKILAVKCQGKGVLKELDYEWKEEQEQGGVMYTIETVYPIEEGEPDNRTYVEIRHMDDKLAEERINDRIKAEIRRIIRKTEWREKWTDEGIYPKMWVMKADREEAVFGYGVVYRPSAGSGYELLKTYIRVDLRTGCCEEIESADQDQAGW